MHDKVSAGCGPLLRSKGTYRPLHHEAGRSPSFWSATADQCDELRELCQSYMSAELLRLSFSPTKRRGGKGREEKVGQRRDKAHGSAEQGG